jgi:N-acetylglucosaminyl-diphospho-decaprenol L-rhamnosyltransferase
MTAALDVVTVFHNDRNHDWAWQLHDMLVEHETPSRLTFNLVDNSIVNRGFAKACNLGAAKGDAPLIGFLNPDAQISGPFLDDVIEAFGDPAVAIAGNDFGKPEREVRAWGLQHWVCGAAMFVRRTFFEEVGGFDERYVWSFEDTDLCRQAEDAGRIVRPMSLPIEHESPAENSAEDARYKRANFALAHAAYYAKWRWR